MVGKWIMVGKGVRVGKRVIKGKGYGDALIVLLRVGERAGGGG